MRFIYKYNKEINNFYFGLNYDKQTDLMAMEKWTGWHASIVMQKIMDGTIKKGAYPIEKALGGKDKVYKNI